MEGRFTIHKTTRWIELSERCGSCQSVPGSVRAPTARICIIPFTSTILIGGLFQSLSPRIFALLLLSFLHTPLPSLFRLFSRPTLRSSLFIQFISLALSFSLSFFQSSLLWISLTLALIFIPRFPFLLTRTLGTLGSPSFFLADGGWLVYFKYFLFFFDSCSR